MKRMLITGSNGFIGKNLKEFYSDKYEIYAALREDIGVALINFKPDIVISAAAEVYDETKMLESNYFYTKDILDYCSKFNVEKLILFGSSSIYGRKSHPISETDAINPESQYERYKAYGLELAQGYSKKFGTNTTFINPFTVVGRYEKERKLFPVLYKKYLNKEALQLAEGTHDFVFIDNFLLAFDAILNYQEQNKFNVINIGSGAQYSNLEVVRAFEEILDYEYLIEHIGKIRPQDSDCWVSNPEKLLTKYGIDVKIDLVEGVRKFIQDCRNLKLYE